MAEKRKTFTSYEVKRRYAVKTYRQYTISLRYDDDAELIQYIEDNKDTVGTTEIFRTALAEHIEGQSD